MSERILAGYQPERYFHWFEELTRIPRGSGNEEEVSKFVLNFALERGLDAERDAIGNVFVRIPAAPGYENEPTILLQSHLDMVCAKDDGVEFDFLTQPIQLRIVDDKVYGTGTTLGSDNGKGVAFMMAVADDPSLAHPALELLFTVQEEIGLLGIQQFDMSKITARRMINTDCGNSHRMCVSSVGSMKYAIEKNFEQSGLEGWATMKLCVQGGIGGHGGTMVHKGRACAINVAGELLHLLKAEMPVRLVEFSTTDAAIHSRSKTVFAVPAGKEKQACENIAQNWEKYSDRYAVSDPHVEAFAEQTEGAQAALSAEDSANLIDLLYLIPTAALRHHGEMPHVVVTSNGVAATWLRNGAFSMTASVRSMIDSERDSACEKLVTIAGLLGFAAERRGGYCGWPAKSGSLMQKRMADLHRELWGEEIEVLHIHGGIEVGAIMAEYPDMDAVGMGPTAGDSHTPNEHLYLKEVQPYWDLLTKFLATKDGDC